jgi:hypothetical protein
MKHYVRHAIIVAVLLNAIPATAATVDVRVVDSTWTALQNISVRLNAVQNCERRKTATDLHGRKTLRITVWRHLIK